MRYVRHSLLAIMAITMMAVVGFYTIQTSKVRAAGANDGPTTPLLVPGPLSDRIVAYKIDAKYDPKTHTVEAQETLTYKNQTGVALDRFPFHLYQNAFQPGSTFMREVRWGGGTRDNKGTWDKKLEASEEISKLEVDGMGDLTSAMKFISPDDGNPTDKTVMEVQLPKPVPPGGEITFRMNFKTKFGEPVMRAGYKRDYLLAGQWFPKVGVWWKSSGSSPKPDPNETKWGWNAHQYHNSTEFFADFGTFDVNLTLPENEVVGSTGVQTAEKKNDDGTKTLTFKAEDVHDFAWTASPSFTVVNDEVKLSTGTVKIRALMSPGHLSSAPRYISNLQGTMKKFDEWYGPWPYSQMTLVDPPAGAGGTGGMEYPMFITLGTSWLMPKSVLGPEMVTEHEFGHNYWYGIVATNEFEDAWMDEGINSYTEVKIMDALYGRKTSMLNSRIGVAGDRDIQRLSYSSTNDLDPLSRNAWQYGGYGSYGAVTYGKTASMLLTLETIVGEDKLREAIHTYFMRYRFKHPTEQDFLNTVNEVTGQDLTWYWEQAVYGTQKFDYKILEAKSDRVDWAKKDKPEEKKGETTYHSQVSVQRKGSFVFPVTLEVKFDNGEKVREKWDGKDRWKRFEWEKKAKIVSAEIDPDHSVILDTNYFNNSYTVEPQKATSKIMTYWVIGSQWLGQMLTWLA
jgi:hypothetical protein